ncbi:MAG: hypothetical protein P8J68_06750 [Arenicellaceae bacterium]|nr:hypothetical protein [Arenicellaceae bacterium]
MFILLYTLLLLLPGCAVLIAFGRKPVTFGEVPLNSLGLFVVATAITGCLGWDATDLKYLYFGLILLAFMAAGWRVRKNPSPRTEINQWLQKPDRYGLLLAASAVIYGFWAGPYTELPADVYWHLGQITDLQLWFSNDDSLEITGLAEVLKTTNYYWYRFVAFTLNFTNTELIGELGPINLINILVFIAAFFSFAKAVLSEGQYLKNIGLAAAIATLFMVLHFGVGPFSYVRYYTFAPAFFALVGFFALMAIFIRVLAAGVISIRLLVGSAALALVVAALHLQEALYLVVMATMLVGVFYLRRSRAYTDSNTSIAGSTAVNTAAVTKGVTEAVTALANTGAIETVTNASQNRSRLVSTLFFSAVGIYVIAHCYLYFFVERNWPLDGDFLQPVSDLLPFAKNLFVLKPTQQFYQVLTVWGVLAYLLYFLSNRKQDVPSYISAGLWSPLFTVFNPVFIDLFLRVSYAEVVWRLCFLITVELYAAWYLVRGWETIRQTGVFKNSTDSGGSHSYGESARMVFVSILLIVFLLPINSRYLENNYSKLTMLAPVAPEASFENFEDMLNFLNTLPPNNLLTDQVTGYAVNAFTPHVYHGHKFFNLYTTVTYLPEYELSDIDDYRGGYLVLNNRDGNVSSFGHEAGGHWPVDIRLYSQQYSNAFSQLVLNNPDVFTNIWQLNSIQVYQIAE